MPNLTQTPAKRGPKPLERSTGKGPVFDIRSGAKNEDGKTMTQAEFAEAVEISKRTIERCEKSGNWPASVHAERALIAFAKARGIVYRSII